MDFNVRFKKWLTENDIKQIDIANRIDVGRSYISNVIAGRVPPSEKLIEEIVKMSGKNSHYWLFGIDEYDNLHSLNKVLNLLIDNGDIKEDGKISEEDWNVIKTFLMKEINIKLDAKYPNRKKG